MISTACSSIERPPPIEVIWISENWFGVKVTGQKSLKEGTFEVEFLCEIILACQLVMTGIPRCRDTCCYIWMHLKIKSLVIPCVRVQTYSGLSSLTSWPVKVWDPFEHHSLMLEQYIKKALITGSRREAENK